MTNRFLILFIVCLPFLQSCSDKNKVKLLETNAKEEVPVLGNLSFVFNKNLAPDSILNRWETEEFIQFEPKIKGKFRWQNPNELVFSPSENLKPATEYKGTIQKSLTKYSKFLLGNTDGISFHTPKLRVEQATGMWIARELNTTDILPEVTLRFNYRIKPADVIKRLSIKNGGDKIEFQSQSEEASETMVLRLTNVKPEDKDLNLAIEIEDGLTPIGGLSATKEPLKSEVNIASPYVLIIGQVTAEHDGINGTVKVYCSQQIADNQSLKDFISFEPAVKFAVDLTDEGMIITSEEFDVEKGYEVSFKIGLKGNVGGVLKESSAHQITFGKLEPSISFVNSAGEYLSSKGEKNLEVRIVNVPEIKVTITKIYENNILSMRKYGYYGGYFDEYYDEEYDSYGSDNADPTFGDVVYEKVITTSKLPKYRNSRLFHFNFPDNLPEFKGIYFVKISSSNEYYLSDNKIVSFSDIGLITRTGKDKLYVFANSIVSTAALNGVSITAYGLNNQKIGIGQTNSEGYAEINLINKNTKGFAPGMITAKMGGDFNCMPFNNTRVETSRFDIGGVRSNATGLRAFIYGDRDIYRPGEKMIFSAIVRNQKWQSPGEIPIKMKVLLPNGKELKVLKKALNNQGSMESFVQLDAASVSGHYSVELYTSTDVLLATKALLVEEFMPDRIKVKANLDKKDYKPGEKLNLSIEAVNYFGPPASGRNYESELQLKERAFNSKAFSNYNFSLSQSDSYYETMLSEGATDEEGKGKEAFEIPAYYKDRGILQADVFTTVFDENGRPVSRATSAPIYTQQVFYGIKNDGYGYYQLNQPVRFNLVALNKDDKPFASAKAKLLVIKHEYKTVLSKSGSYFRYNSQLEDKTIVDKEITLSGSNSYYDFIPRSPGNYELRIARPGAGTYVSASFYSYGYWGNYGNSFEVNREGNIDIALDKTSYHTGESAQVLFKTPFNGKMLVTIEQDEVISHQYVEVKNRAAAISIDLKSEHLPNAYVTATLIKPHTESNIPLTVAHGYSSIIVEDLTNKIPVRIEAVDKSRSNTKQRITVKSMPGAKVTLAAVDEGILQITGFKTPDPYGYFYAKRALETSAHDIYPFLLPELRGSKSTGGDGFDLSKRVNPLPNKRVKLVANWSGIADSKSGEIVFDVDIPAFSGEIRLMAVAYKDNKFGSAESKITVADPIVISTGMPRFLSPGDTAYVSVNLTNTTEKSTSAQIKIITAGGIKSMDNSYAASLTANGENRKIVKLVAGNATVTAKYTVSVSAFGETFKEEIDITVRPAASLQKATKNGAINGGSAEVINLAGMSFMPATESRSLVVSRSPVLQFAEHLEYLVQYPHGCTEQIVSAAFPQLYFGDISEMMQNDETGQSFANANVQEAIRSIKMRQLYSGGLTLWESGGQEHWWASAYATHFLLEAKQAGYEVDKDLLNNLLDYLKSKVKQRNYVSYFYNRNENKRIAPKEMAYSLFVLAVANKSDISTMNYYKQRPEELAIDSRFLLSAAYAIAGDKQKFREMLPSSFSGEEANPETGGSFASAIRDEGVALYAIMEADPGNPLIGTMANHLGAQLKARNYLSTQERAFAFLCLGKLAKQAATSTVAGVVKVDGKTVGTVNSNTLKLNDKQLNGKQIEISTSGTGKLYYFYSTEGIPTGPVKEEDNFMRVRKTFYNRFGNVISGNSFKSNELIIVGITIENTYSSSIENVVITDLLPAGFEIENHRVKQLPGMSWIKDASFATHVDIRDDRINFYLDLNNGKSTYYYAVRAVSSGSFKMGPVMADAMYRGEMHSYNGAGTIHVSAR
jgi:alpha-2-macroglobulin